MYTNIEEKLWNHQQHPNREVLRIRKLLRDLTLKSVMSLDDSSINYNSLLGDEVNIAI